MPTPADTHTHTPYLDKKLNFLKVEMFLQKRVYQNLICFYFLIELFVLEATDGATMFEIANMLFHTGNKIIL